MTKREIKERLYDDLKFNEISSNVYQNGLVIFIVSDDMFSILRQDSSMVLNGKIEDIKGISLDCDVFLVEFSSGATYLTVITSLV